MVKSHFLRAVALIETTGAEDSAQKQSVVRDFAASKEIEIISFLAVAHLDEPGIKEALRVAKENKAGRIIFDAAHTLRLIPATLISIIDQFIEQGIALGFAKTQVSFFDAELRSMRDIFLASAGALTLARSQQIKSGLQHKKRVASRSFGVDEEEKKVIALILELHAQGKSLQEICETLAFRDLKAARKRKWYPTSIKRIIDRAKKTKSVS